MSPLLSHLGRSGASRGFFSQRYLEFWAVQGGPWGDGEGGKQTEHSLWVLRAGTPRPLVCTHQG